MNLFKSLGGQKDGAPKAKKRSGYYLELDEAGQAVEAAPEAAPAPVAAVTAAPEAAPAPTAEAPAPAAAPTAAAAKAALKASKAAAPAVEAPKAAPTPAATPAGMTFAPNFLMPSTGGRRMPGPSMSPFMDMARQVGQPRQS